MKNIEQSRSRPDPVNGTGSAVLGRAFDSRRQTFHTLHEKGSVVMQVKAKNQRLSVNNGRQLGRNYDNPRRIKRRRRIQP